MSARSFSQGSQASAVASLEPALCHTVSLLLLGGRLESELSRSCHSIEPLSTGAVRARGRSREGGRSQGCAGPAVALVWDDAVTPASIGPIAAKPQLLPRPDLLSCSHC